MDNKYISLDTQKNMIDLGYRLEVLRKARKKNSEKKEDLGEVIDILSTTLLHFMGKHVSFNKDNEVVLVSPLKIRKIEKKINTKIKNDELTKSSGRSLWK